MVRIKQLQKWFNLRLTSQYPFCPYALSMDLYRGCPHRCIYCFAQQQYYSNIAVKDKSFSTPSGGVDLKKLERYLEGEYIGKTGPTGFIQYLLTLKQPIHIGGMYDPFPLGWENYYKLGEKTLKLLNKYDYPAILSTKNPLKDYDTLFKNGHYVLQVSSSLPAGITEKVEKSTLPFEKRLEAVEHLVDYVDKVVIRLQPFIIGVWDEKELEEYIKELSSIGVHAITTEFLKFTVFTTKGVRRQMELLGEAVNRNIFSDLSHREGDSRVYPPSIRLKWLLKIRAYTHKYGMEFYSAENYFRDLGDGFACCGINHNNPKEKMFYTKLRYTTNEGLFIAKEKGEVAFEDMVRNTDEKLLSYRRLLDMWNTQNKVFRSKYINLTFKDLLYNVWCTKNSANPAVFFKALVPVKKPNGKIVYKYVPYVEEDRKNEN